MELLRVHPDPDIYANGIGFQIAAFAFTKGLISIVILAVILLVEASLLRKRDSQFD